MYEPKTSATGRSPAKSPSRTRAPLGHMYAMARAARIYDGPDEVHKMVVSRRILKEFADGGTYRFD